MKKIAMTVMTMMKNFNMEQIIKGENYLITGSSVLNLRYIKDIDVICYLEDILIETTGDEFIRSARIDGMKYEFLLADNQPSLQELLGREYYFTPEEIYLILKRGHLHIAGRRQENWEKHMCDYNILKKIVNEKDSDIQKLIKLHRESTDARIKQRTPRLNGVSKEKFFDDKVRKYIDHDLIHEEVAYEDQPMFTLMQKDATVTCHKDLWLEMSHTQQLQCVSEEAMTINIERNLLPSAMGQNNFKPALAGYRWALWRICTTLCSGWFREFAIDNYYEILNMFDEEKINSAVDNIVLKIKISK